MIYIIDQDLLLSNCEIICHQANCEMVMGSGIAKSIKEKYPLAYEADRNFELKGNARFGHYSFAKQEQTYIVNLYGQLRYRRKGEPPSRKTSYLMLSKAINKMLVKIKEWEKVEGRELKLGMPYNIGCGRAGGDWHVVVALIEELSYLHKKDIYLYKISN
ncbi:macro domain-containing protein [Bacillus cereus]|uniref:Macro domain-containing protein n=1 Tax=Bacillus cereus TaxID=1396 RepID=A0A164P6X0_BACCE|nr:macro domain-containing protein [Bacillus cereus]KZD66342.1 hypothetical protein B4088_2458 [Bacillus cereus]